MEALSMLLFKPGFSVKEITQTTEIKYFGKLFVVTSQKSKTK